MSVESRSSRRFDHGWFPLICWFPLPDCRFVSNFWIEASNEKLPMETTGILKLLPVMSVARAWYASVAVEAAGV